MCSVIKHDAKTQCLACGAREPSQALEIGRLQVADAFTSMPNEFCSLALDHEVDFVLILVSVMRVSVDPVPHAGYGRADPGRAHGRVRRQGFDVSR